MITKPNTQRTSVGQCVPPAGLWAKSANRNVAQVSNLLYRRFPIGNMFSSPALSANSKRVQAGSTAIQQVGNLRYDFVHRPGTGGTPDLGLVAGAHVK